MGNNPVNILKIWNGGLGIWGAIAGGVLGGALKARRMGLPLAPLLDVVAPVLALAQAIGRWGNYFNQELFGLPSKLPWAVRITDQAQLADLPAKYRPPMGPHGYLPGTFQPTFLYECLWDLATFGLLLLIERKIRLRRGYLFAAYAALYTLGRFFTEYVRIDPAHRYLGLRLNDWTSVAVFAVAAGLLLWKGRPTASHSLVGQPLPAAVLAAERAQVGAQVGTPAAGEAGATAFGILSESPERGLPVSSGPPQDGADSAGPASEVPEGDAPSDAPRQPARTDAEAQAPADAVQAPPADAVQAPPADAVQAPPADTLQAAPETGRLGPEPAPTLTVGDQPDKRSPQPLDGENPGPVEEVVAIGEADEPVTPR